MLLWQFGVLDTEMPHEKKGEFYRRAVLWPGEKKSHRRKEDIFLFSKGNLPRKWGASKYLYFQLKLISLLKNRHGNSLPMRHYRKSQRNRHKSGRLAFLLLSDILRLFVTDTFGLFF